MSILAKIRRGTPRGEEPPPSQAADPGPGREPAHAGASRALGARRAASIAAAALVAAAALAALLPRLAAPALHADEMTYMISVVESLHAGSFWPLENGRPFVRKPPLGFWLIRLSFQWLGPTPFAARLPAALATAATAALLYLLGAAWQSRTAGLLAAGVFVLLPGPLAEHAWRAATFDALEILLVATAIACLELWRRGGRSAALAGYFAALALTAWAKSPFGGVVIVAYLLASEPLLRRRGARTRRFAPLVAASVGVWVAAVALWLAALAARSSLQSVVKRVVGQQYARRIEGRLNPRHVEGRTYYVKVLREDFGVLLLVPLGAYAVRLARRRRPEDEGLDRAALVVWALAAPILASLSDSKLPRYVYTSYPGLALLVAADAERLAATVARSPALRAALLGGLVAWSAWRLPAARIWPASHGHGPSACLLDLPALGARLEQSGPLPVRRRGRLRGPMNHEVRAARLFLDAALWRQGREPPSEPSCVGHVVAQPARDSVELLAPHERWGPGIYLVDACGGRLRERLLAPRCGARPASPPVPRPAAGPAPSPPGASG